MSSNRRKSSLPEQTGLPKVGSDRLVELGEALRAEIADVQNEPIPERLQKLIDALKALETDEGDGDRER